MAAKYSRIHRLLKIITLIQGSTGWTPARLARECGTTERTIYRDLRMLEAAGIPYFHDPETGYGVRRDFFLPPVQLALDEALALVALAEQVGGDEQIPFTQPAGRAIAKIRGQLPDAIRSEVERIANHVAIKLSAAAPPEAAADVYETVRGALTRRKALRCTYEPGHTKGRTDLHKDTDPFLFKPYTLLFNQRAWYVLGHHGGHDTIRCMKLNRFTMLQPTSHPYSIPRGFSLKEHLGNAWRIIRGSETFDVELKFDPEFAETIADTHWHPTQDVDWNEDGSITFRCRVDGLDEIVWWILSMGPHCVVRQPAALAKRVKHLATQLVRRYGQPARQS